MHTPTPLVDVYPDRLAITTNQVSAALSTALELQNSGLTLHSKRPFAAVLLGPDNETIILTHTSVSHVRHAESALSLLASDHYSQDFLWKCTLVSTWEPCAMCAGTMYWANIGRVIYGASEKNLRKLTGDGNLDNTGLDLPCREVFGQGQKKIEIIGPVVGWEEKIVTQSRPYWRNARERL